MDRSIDAIITRTRQSFYRDGLWELLAGGVLLSGGLTIFGSISGNTGAIIFASSILVIFYLYSWAKKHYINPRSGYAVYKKQGLKAQIFMILKRALFLFILVAVYLILISPDKITEYKWFVFIIGIFIGSGWTFQGVRLGLPRLILLGITSMLLGAVLSPLLLLAYAMEKSVLEIVGTYFLMMGTAFLLSGGVTFWSYLHNERQNEGVA